MQELDYSPKTLGSLQQFKYVELLYTWGKKFCTEEREYNNYLSEIEKKVQNTNLTIHVIFMYHHDVGNAKDPWHLPQIAQSQRQVFNLLEQIKPGVVGAEGCSTPRFDLRTWLQEGLALHKLLNGDTASKSVKRAQQQLQKNRDKNPLGIVDYQHKHRQAIIVGLEKKTPLIFQGVIIKTMGFFARSSIESLMLDRFFELVTEVRSALSLPMLIEAMINEGKKVAAFPVGKAHQPHIEHWSSFWPCKFIVHDTTTG